MLIALCAACTSREMSTPESPTIYRISPTSSLHYDVEDSVRTNSKVFGCSPFIFDSYDECYILLDSLQEMGFEDLRKWSQNNNITCNAIEAIIEMDSTYYHIAKKYGVYLDENGMIYADSSKVSQYEPLLTTIDSVFWETINPNYISTTKINGVTYNKPAYAIDQRIFANEKDLFIVEGMVHRYVGDEFIVCPFDLYPHIESFTSISDMENYIRKNMSAQDQDRIQLQAEQWFYNTESTNSTKCKTTVHIEVLETRSFFGTARSWATATITNYVKGSNNSFNKRCCWTDVDITIHATDQKGNSAVFYLPEIKRKRAIGNRTLSSYNTYFNTRSSAIHLTSASINISTKEGAKIEEDKDF